LESSIFNFVFPFPPLNLIVSGIPALVTCFPAFLIPVLFNVIPPCIPFTIVRISFIVNDSPFEILFTVLINAFPKPHAEATLINVGANFLIAFPAFVIFAPVPIPGIRVPASKPRLIARFPTSLHWNPSLDKSAPKVAREPAAPTPAAAIFPATGATVKPIEPISAIKAVKSAQSAASIVLESFEPKPTAFD